MEQDVPEIPESVADHILHSPETPVDRAFRLSTWGIGLLLLLTVVGVVIWQYYSVAEAANRMIPDLLTYFAQGGQDVGPHEPLANTSGATWAEKAEINGEAVYIFRFTPEASKEQTTLLKQIIQQQSIEIDGKQVPARINGPFVLAGYKGNPREQELLRAFEGFGTFSVGQP